MRGLSWPCWLCLLALLAGAPGCRQEFEIPRTLIHKPRVLAIVAEPPEVIRGASSTLTIHVAGTAGQMPVVSWSRCRRGPLPGQAVNPDCIDNAQAAYIEPIGEGTTITTAMPADITAASLGQPDASGGVYLTLIARVTVGGSSLAATYRLRLGVSAAAANRNPQVADVFAAAAAGSSSLDETAPLIVHAGERLSLTAVLAARSSEVYVSPVAGPEGNVVEVVRTSWFSTAGNFSNEKTSVNTPQTVLRLDDDLPGIGSLIDLFVVTRDERGGTNFQHRLLRLE
jgi:hypothetical protein